jgi:hypothetical protein
LERAEPVDSSTGGKRGQHFLEFKIDRNSDPDRSKLRTLLEAQFAYERMRTARSWFAHLLAALGVVLWCEVIWPDSLSDVRFFLLAVYGGVFFLTVRAAIAEFLSHRKLNDCINRGLASEYPDHLS